MSKNGVLEEWSNGVMVKPAGQKTDKTSAGECMRLSCSAEFCFLTSVFFIPVLQHSNTPLLQSLEVLS